jgi:hypothetical protein
MFVVVRAVTVLLDRYEFVFFNSYLVPIQKWWISRFRPRPQRFHNRRQSEATPRIAKKTEAVDAVDLVEALQVMRIGFSALDQYSEFR